MAKIKLIPTLQQAVTVLVVLVLYKVVKGAVGSSLPSQVQSVLPTV